MSLHRPNHAQHARSGVACQRRATKSTMDGWVHPLMGACFGVLLIMKAAATVRTTVKMPLQRCVILCKRMRAMHVVMLAEIPTSSDDVSR